MEAQQILVNLESAPAAPNEPPPQATPSSKPVFGQKHCKGKPGLSADEVEDPKLKPVDRSQISLKVIDLEHLIDPGHSARAIWDLAGRLDLDRFLSAIRSQQGEKGRAANSPKMLVSVWIYAYSQGVSSAREIERLMGYEPGLRWLCGDDPVNHHTLSDFRVDHRKALDELFQQVLAVLDGEQLIDLSQVMHDGTKVQANAGVDTFRSKKTLDARLEQARQLLEQMGDPREDNPQARTRKQAAQERAARERMERMAAAAEEMEQLLKDKTAAEAEKARVSRIEPEARKMKHGNNAILPSYNVQLSTESSNKIIVGMHVSQCSSDAQSLVPAVDKIEENTGRCPDQMVADGGFTNKPNIIAMEERKIDLIGSLPDLEKKRTTGVVAAGIAAEFSGRFFIFNEQTGTLECPAGKVLDYQSQSNK